MACTKNGIKFDHFTVKSSSQFDTQELRKSKAGGENQRSYMPGITVVIPPLRVVDNQPSPVCIRTGTIKGRLKGGISKFQRKAKHNIILAPLGLEPTPPGGVARVSPTHWHVTQHGT